MRSVSAALVLLGWLWLAPVGAIRGDGAQKDSVDADSSHRQHFPGLIKHPPVIPQDRIVNIFAISDESASVNQNLNTGPLAKRDKLGSAKRDSKMGSVASMEMASMGMMGMASMKMMSMGMASMKMMSMGMAPMGMIQAPSVSSPTVIQPPSPTLPPVIYFPSTGIPLPPTSRQPTALTSFPTTGFPSPSVVSPSAPSSPSIGIPTIDLPTGAPVAVTPVPTTGVSPAPTLGTVQPIAPSSSSSPSAGLPTIDTPPPTSGVPIPSLTIEQFLTATITDDGSLQTDGTPQKQALDRLLQTNGNLNPTLEQEQLEIFQRYSLNTLYYATDGPGWNNSALWTSEQDVCTWFGVICDGSFVSNLTLSLNNLFGNLPSEIRGVPNLVTLDLSMNNFLSGTIPSTIGLLSKLQHLILSSNSFGATSDLNGPGNLVPNPLPSEIANLLELLVLDLSDNFFHPTFPFNLIVPLSKLETLSFRLNLFDGAISSIGQLPKSLITLDLSANGITGTLPTEIGLLTLLRELKIATSDLQETPDGTCSSAELNPNGCLRGSIPTEIGNLINLQLLWLYENSLTGTLPPEMGNLMDLRELVIDTNQFFGSMPDSITNLQSLEYIDIASNSFGPSFPTVFVQQIPSLQFVFLGLNSFSDSFPDSFNLPNVRIISVAGNSNLGSSLPATLGQLSTLTRLEALFCSLTGTLPIEISSLILLDTLDLESNLLAGPIPVEYGGLTLLKTLTLASNKLSQGIPTQLGNLVLLEKLDLFNNTFTGTIPTELGNLVALTSLELDLNQLSGTAPDSVCSLTPNPLELFATDCGGSNPRVACSCCTSCSTT